MGVLSLCFVAVLVAYGPFIGHGSFMLPPMPQPEGNFPGSYLFHKYPCLCVKTS